MNDLIQPGGPAKGLVARAQAIITTPKAEWQVVATETTKPADVLLQYALPLMAIGPVCTVLGSFLAPYSLGMTYYASTAIVSFVLSIASLFLMSFIANFLSPKFDGKDDFASAFRLMAYAQTPSWLLGVLSLLLYVAPLLGILGLLALYGLYLFYLGSTPVMGVPEEKAAGYTVVTVVCAIVLYIVVGAVTTAIVAGFIISNPAVVIYR